MALDKNGLLALIANLYPDNNANEITPSKLRQGLEEMVSSDLNLEELTEQLIKGMLAQLLLTTTNPDPAWKEGLVFYDSVEKCLSYYNDEMDTKINCGQEIVERVVNDNGSTFLNGEVVTVTGASGGFPTVVRSIAISSVAGRSIGMVTHDIEVGNVGYVTYIGKVRGIDTSMFAEGDPLYVSDTTPGGVTNVAPRIASLVGIVLVSDAVDGVVLVGPEELIEESALAQVSTGAAHTQSLTTTPVPMEGYSGTAFNQNVNVIITPSNGSNRVQFKPDEPDLSGFYEISFQVTGESSNNQIVVCELYRSGVQTGLLGKFDFTQGTIDEGTIVLSAFTEDVLTEVDDLEIYIYTQSGTTDFEIDNIIFNCKRIGGL